MDQELDPGRGIGKALFCQGHVRRVGGSRTLRLLHNDESRDHEVFDEALSRNSRHQFVGLKYPFSASVTERKGQGVGEFVWCGGTKVGSIGHERSLPRSESFRAVVAQSAAGARPDRRVRTRRARGQQTGLA
jgi:hypothetical protein